MRRVLLTTSLFFVCNSLFGQTTVSAKELFLTMMQAMKNVRSCSYVLDMQERVFGKTTHAQYITKVNAQPQMIYVYSVEPNPGAEALYVENSNNNKVLVNPNRFPYINLDLSINSMLLRKAHQFSILQMGFNYLQFLLEKNEQKNSEKFYSALRYEKDILWNKKDYDVLEIINPDFNIIEYKVQKGENVTDIANKLLVNDHMILELNDEISDYDDVKAGQIIKVPDSFAEKIVLYIDKLNHLPLVQFIYDDKGLYSRIEISSLVINPAFQHNEFTRSFPKYKF